MDESNTEETRWRLSRYAPPTTGGVDVSRGAYVQPKPASGEWTVRPESDGWYIWFDAMNAARIDNELTAKAIADAHNASLADEQQRYDKAMDNAMSELEKQLAAEREKVAELEQQNKTFRAAQKACEDCDGPTMAEVQQMREQLAAERVKLDQATSLLERVTDKGLALEQQLAAEREKVQVLEMELDTFRSAMPTAPSIEEVGKVMAQRDHAEQQLAAAVEALKQVKATGLSWAGDIADAALAKIGG